MHDIVLNIRQYRLNKIKGEKLMEAQEKCLFLKIQAMNHSPANRRWISEIWYIYDDRSIERIETVPLEGRLADLIHL